MRGKETIIVTPVGEKDWQGDPIPGASGVPYDITGCITWPVMREDDGSIVPEVRDLFVPPGSAEVEADSIIFTRDAKWSIDGSADGEYISKAGQPKGTIMRLKRIL